MNRNLRNRNEIKKPVKYVPITELEEITDNQSVDSDWDNESEADKASIKSEIDSSNDEEDDYVYDDFVVDDDEVISVYDNSESEAEADSSDSDSEK